MVNQKHEFQTQKVEELLQHMGSATIIEATTSGTATFEVTIPHSLGRVPGALIVISRDKAGRIVPGHTPWTDTNIYVKSNLASVAFLAILTYAGNDLVSADQS